MAGGLRTVNALWRQEADVFACSEATPFAPGQLGAVAAVANTTAVDPGPEGTKLVQYVKRRSTDALTLTTGQALYWSDLDNFVVTDTQSAAVGGTTKPLVAGFVQSTNPQPGSYGYIQVGGQGAILVLGSTVASTTGAPQGRPVVAAVNQTTGHVTFQYLLSGATDATTLLAAATTANLGLPQLGVVLTSSNATGASITIEALINVPRNSW